MTSKRVIFQGRVQGVGFRYATKQLALGFDVVGTVKNLPDRTVQLEVMGDQEEVDEFITEIIEESDLSGFIKGHTVWDIDPMDNCRGFTISH